MPKTKEQKKAILKNLLEKISQAKSIVFARFNKLAVKDNEELRALLKKEGSEYYVSKKTLLEIAFKEAKVNGADIKKIPGQVAAVFSYGDEVVAAKIMDKFKKSIEGEIEFVGGILENKFILPDQVQALAKLPSKAELYAKLVGSINAPVSGFVNALAGNLRNLVSVLKAIEEKSN